MKTNLFIIVFLVGAFQLHAQQSERKLKNARNDMSVAKEDLKQAKKDSIAEYQQFKTESKEKIAANEKAISELRAKQIAKGKKVDKEFEQKIQNIQERNALMKAKVDNYKADGNTNWVVFKREFNEQMKALEKSFMESRDED